MLKWLDKYMDNLKSPYWEVYFSIIVIAFGIAGTAIIFIDPMGLASKFGNTGSFLGGLFTIAAVVIAIISYKKSKNDHINRVVFDKKHEVTLEILPSLQECLEMEIWTLRSQLEGLERNINIEYHGVQSHNLLKLKVRLELSERSLKNLGAVKDSGDMFYKKLIKLINEIHFNSAVVCNLKKVEEGQRTSLLMEILKSDVYIEYIKTENDNSKKSLFDINNRKVELLVDKVLTNYFV